jgi:hypothetical protein
VVVPRLRAFGAALGMTGKKERFAAAMSFMQREEQIA